MIITRVSLSGGRQEGGEGAWRRPRGWGVWEVAGVGGLREELWEEGVEFHETKQWARAREGDQLGKGRVARNEARAVVDRVMGVAACTGRQRPEHRAHRPGRSQRTLKWRSGML